MPNKTEKLKENLLRLKLYHTESNLTETAEAAKKSSFTDSLSRLCEQEINARDQKSTDRRLKSSKLGKHALMDTFDWSWPSRIDKGQVTDLLELGFIEKAENIILLGAEGLGKTMIAKNLAWRAIQAGRTARFIRAAELVNELSAAGHRLEGLCRRYASTDLLVIDEIGYLNFNAQAADLLFDIVSRRHEQKSIVTTTNLAFKDWGGIFPGASCVTALVDRLTERSHIVKISGKSFRQKKATGAQK